MAGEYAGKGLLHLDLNRRGGSWEASLPPTKMAAASSFPTFLQGEDPQLSDLLRRHATPVKLTP
jgi:hypothetical protein